MTKEEYRKWFLGLVCSDLYKMPLETYCEIGEKDEKQLELFENALNPNIVKNVPKLFIQLEKSVDVYHSDLSLDSLPSELDVLYMDTKTLIDSKLLGKIENIMHDLSLLFVLSTLTINEMVKITQEGGSIQPIKVLKVCIDNKCFNLFVLSKNFDAINQSEYRMENLLDFEKNEREVINENN